MDLPRREAASGGDRAPLRTPLRRGAKVVTAAGAEAIGLARVASAAEAQAGPGEGEHGRCAGEGPKGGDGGDDQIAVAATVRPGEAGMFPLDQAGAGVAAQEQHAEHLN